MEILHFPHPMLFKACKKVTVFGEELKILLDGMWETMHKAHGMGLSANQVGLDLAMFVMEGPDGERFNIVNPEIMSKSAAPANLKEGCLSAVGDFIVVPERASWVQVRFQDEKGEFHTRVFRNIYSVCALHEMEHLEGKAFMENSSIPKVTRKTLAKKWQIK